MAIVPNVNIKGYSKPPDSVFKEKRCDNPFKMSNETRIYIGNLPPDIRSKDIEDLFYKYGKIVFIDLKNRRGPPFAFVEFEDAR